MLIRIPKLLLQFDQDLYTALYSILSRILTGNFLKESIFFAPGPIMYLNFGFLSLSAFSMVSETFTASIPGDVFNFLIEILDQGLVDFEAFGVCFFDHRTPAIEYLA